MEILPSDTETVFEWKMRQQLNYKPLAKCKCCKELEADKWFDNSDLCFICKRVFSFGRSTPDKNYEYYSEWLYTRYAHRVMALDIYPALTFNPKLLEIAKRKIRLIICDAKIKNIGNGIYKFNIRLLNLFKEEVWDMRYRLYKFESL